MRQHKILIRTLLILSIINFALAAPAAVRARPELHLGASVIRNVPAGPQKRWDPWDWGVTSNVPAPDHAPAPSPDLADIAYADSLLLTPDDVPDHEPTSSPDLTGILLQTAHADSPPPTPDSLPPSPGNTRPLPSELWDNVAGSLPPIPPIPPHPSQPGPSEDHSPSPSGLSVNPDTFPATGPTDNEPALPQSPEVDPQMHSLLNPEPFPSEFWDKVLKGKF